jgi:hypothetical protein
MSLPEKVTTYLHVFVYHFGYFIARYGGLERLANYSTEGIVGEVKRTALSAAPKHGSKDPLATIRVVLKRFARIYSLEPGPKSTYL